MDSISASDDDTEMEVLDGSFIWSQDDPLSPNEIWEITPESEKKTFPLCRLCAGFAENPIYIYSEIGESMKLSHKINTCLSIKVII